MEQNESKINDTKLLYLNDTYMFEGEAKILKFDQDTKGKFVVLDQTIFYAQGGGQPCDFGIIDSQELSLNINFVSFNNGLVQHYFKDEIDQNKLDNLIGRNVSLKIDSERRIINAKSHTSGHLLASIVEKLDKELVGMKGYHFPEGPYVEFKGKLSALTSEELIQKAGELMKERIQSNAIVTVQEEADAKQIEPKKSRLVQIEGYEPVI
jgi:Ser-tRNA(Ala) deacylase AlaX